MTVSKRHDGPLRATYCLSYLLPNTTYYRTLLLALLLLLLLPTTTKNNYNKNKNKVQAKTAAPLQHILFLCLYAGMETTSAAPSLFFGQPRKQPDNKYFTSNGSACTSASSGTSTSGSRSRSRSGSSSSSRLVILVVIAPVVVVVVVAVAVAVAAAAGAVLVVVVTGQLSLCKTST